MKEDSQTGGLETDCLARGANREALGDPQPTRSCHAGTRLNFGAESGYQYWIVVGCHCPASKLRGTKKLGPELATEAQLRANGATHRCSRRSRRRSRRHDRRCAPLEYDLPCARRVLYCHSARAYSVANQHAPSVMVIRVVHVSSTEMDVISVGLSRVKLRRPRSMEEGPGSEACEARPCTLRGRRKTTGSVRTIASVLFRCACLPAILSWAVSRVGMAELSNGRPVLFAVVHKCLSYESDMRRMCKLPNPELVGSDLCHMHTFGRGALRRSVCGPWPLTWIAALSVTPAARELREITQPSDQAHRM
jgi:hypothetical protein